MPQQIEATISLIEELQELYGDQNKIIYDETAEFYSAIALVRNILELINKYNQENPSIKLPRSDRLRNELTHYPFMINPEELINFIDSKLNSNFIEHIKLGKNIGNKFFEDARLHIALKEYLTDPESILQHIRQNKFNYVFHCIDYLKKFIEYAESNNNLAAQFSLEQALVITKLLKEVVPELESCYQDKFMEKFLNEQFFDNYIKQLRNPSAHGSSLTSQRLQQLIPTMKKLLSSLNTFFLNDKDKLECFSRSAPEICPRLEKIASSNIAGFGLTLNVIEEHLKKQEEEAKSKTKLQEEKQTQQNQFRQDMLKKIADRRAALEAEEEAKKQKTDQDQPKKISNSPCLVADYSDSDEDNQSQKEQVQQAIKESLKNTEKIGKVGSRTIKGCVLKDVEGKGNCFYLAIADQLQCLNHSIFSSVHESTALHDWLRLQIQGENFKDFEWAEDKTIDAFVKRFPEIVLAIVDTRNSQAGFVCYYLDGSSVITNTGSDPNIVMPSDKTVIKIAATGNHYLAVKSHSALVSGVIREAWNIETAGQSNKVGSSRRGPES